VVVAASRPGLVVLGGKLNGIGLEPFGDLEAMNEAVASVGVLLRVDQDEVVCKDLIDQLVIAGRKQVISGEQRRIGDEISFPWTP
jgi:hypothetical protein